MYGNLINKIEETLVNGCRGNMSEMHKLLRSPQNTSFVNDMLLYNKSLEKEYRLRYFNLMDEYYMYMKEMCEKLKAFPKDGANCRNDMLKGYANNMNNMILTNRAEFEEPDSISKCFYKGVLLPFDDNIHTSDEYNSLVCFNLFRLLE
jgi:hypothetical protein